MKPALMLAITLLFATASNSVAGQSSSHVRSLESQLRCRRDPEAGKLLVELRASGYIDRTYIVEDTISYFKLLKPLVVLGFRPVAVFGFQEGYEKFFERGPGTTPPEMIGIVVRGNQDSVKLRLRSLGIHNLEVEPHAYNTNGGAARSGLVSIACWSTREK
ncbi:MAG: hypothetical protein PSX80_17295 [bacterium]|nr:hypothetical protein [bacterium]